MVSKNSVPEGKPSSATSKRKPRAKRRPLLIWKDPSKFGSGFEDTIWEEFVRGSFGQNLRTERFYSNLRKLKKDGRLTIDETFPSDSGTGK